MHNIKEWLQNLPLKKARKVVVFLVGGTLLLLGIAMIVLPGPAVVVIPLALAILGTEFVWARWLLQKVKKRIKSGLNLQNKKEE